MPFYYVACCKPFWEEEKNTNYDCENQQNGGAFDMGESSKFPKSWTFEIEILKHSGCPLNIHNFKFKLPIIFRQTVFNKKTYS